MPLTDCVAVRPNAASGLRIGKVRTDRSGHVAPGESNISTVGRAGLGMLYASVSLEARSSSLVSTSMSYSDWEVGSESYSREYLCSTGQSHRGTDQRSRRDGTGEKDRRMIRTTRFALAGLSTVIFCLFIEISATAGGAADLSPIGVWATGGATSHVKIDKCGGKLCGALVWLKEPLNKEGKDKVDSENPAPELRMRKLLGLPLLEGFVQDEDQYETFGPTARSTILTTARLIPVSSLSRMLTRSRLCRIIDPRKDPVLDPGRVGVLLSRTTMKARHTAALALMYWALMLDTDRDRHGFEEWGGRSAACFACLSWRR